MLNFVASKFKYIYIYNTIIQKRDKNNKIPNKIIKEIWIFPQCIFSTIWGIFHKLTSQFMQILEFLTYSIDVSLCYNFSY